MKRAGLSTRDDLDNAPHIRGLSAKLMALVNAIKDDEDLWREYVGETLPWGDRSSYAATK